MYADINYFNYVFVIPFLLIFSEFNPQKIFVKKNNNGPRPGGHYVQ